MKKSPKLGFSLIELSIVILIIGILVVGITKGSRIVSEARLKSARALTTSSPVASTSNLVIWLESTSEKSFTDSERVNTLLTSEGTITTWFDINPHTTSGNNAIQTGASNLRPRYVANGINGLPALNFDGSNDYFDFNGNILVNTDFTIFAVSKLSDSGTTGNRMFMGGPNKDYISLGYVAGNYYHEMYTDAGRLTTSAALPKRSASIITLVHASTVGLKHYINSVNVSNNPAVTGHLANFNSATIGKCVFLGVFKGDLGEIIMFNRRLSDAERIAIENYLKAKWVIK